MIALPTAISIRGLGQARAMRVDRWSLHGTAGSQIRSEARTQALDLTIALGYIERLLANTHVEKYLAKHHVELLNEFTKLVGEKAEEMSRAIPEPIKGSLRTTKVTVKGAADCFTF